ncbi:MAG TPA: hypothetical protein VHE30_29065 [Polyangiaceae bacterium]|nr:hypothetical protein [Polyangiaceae bacterium]
MFHETNPTLFGRPDSVLTGTRALQSTLSELRAANTCLAHNLPDAFFATRRLLSDFSTQLSGYFDVSESARHFNAIARECPSLEHRARVLERAHRLLKRSFATAGEPALRREKVCTLAFSARIDGLLEDFEEHEHAERELLQDFFNRIGEAPCHVAET